MDELTREFLIESQEGLDRMEECLTELEARPDDAELIGEIFRAVHTIKGTTGFLGFHRLESLSHAGENLLSEVRDGRVKPTSPVITCLLQLMDGLRSILQLIGATGDEGKRAGDDDAALIATIRSFQTPPDPRAELAAIERGDVVPGRPWRTVLAEMAAAEVDGARYGIPLPPSAAEDSARSLPQPVALAQPQPSPPPAISAIPAQTASQSALHDAGASPESTLRVDVDLLNRMMNMVGELVLTRNRILQTTAGDESFAVLGRRLDMVTADLREAVMKARMQPVGHVFQKFPRMVRDLARTCGRQVRLELEGQETELDKSLLEAVRDPLTHAVRNSIDHGIESPEARLLAGKPKEGVLRLRASQEGGHVVIEVSDDGAGISPEKILTEALERKLITAAKAASLTPREVLQLIFLPGFSTAARVTNISGRGVGMDVVRANVERIGGNVELDSEMGVGTRLRMRIPLTLAIIPALVVKACGQNFAVPHNALFELVRLPADSMEEAVEWVGRSPVYRLRNQLLPLVWLAQLLGLETAASKSAEATGSPAVAKPSYLVVLEADGTRFGLVVDELLDPEEIVVKPISAVLGHERLFSGATILGNGNLALILDPSAVADLAEVPRKIDAEDTSPAPSAQEQPDDELPYLLFSGGGNELYGARDLPRTEGEAAARSWTHSAVPLETVERIETVPYGRIEYADGNAYLQFRGGTLPLWDGSGLLPELRQAGLTDTPVSVLVCSAQDSHLGEQHVVGLVVRDVLDVARGRIIAPVEPATRDQATSPRTVGPIAPQDGPQRAKDTDAGRPVGEMVLLNGRITPIFDLRYAAMGRLAPGAAIQSSSEANLRRREVA